MSTQAYTHLPRAAVLTVRETCELFRFGRTKFYQMVHSGDLKTIKIGSGTRVTMQSIYALLDRANAEAANDNGRDIADPASAS